MGFIHPEGVLMLPKGCRPEGSIKTAASPCLLVKSALLYKNERLFHPIPREF